MQIQAGAGGTESMDWASMIFNMYKSWALRRGFGVTVIEEIPGEIAGIKVIQLSSVMHHIFFCVALHVNPYHICRKNTIFFFGICK